jgi:hypothetical protein
VSHVLCHVSFLVCLLQTTLRRIQLADIITTCHVYMSGWNARIHVPCVTAHSYSQACDDDIIATITTTITTGKLHSLHYVHVFWTLLVMLVITSSYHISDRCTHMCVGSDEYGTGSACWLHSYLPPYQLNFPHRRDRDAATYIRACQQPSCPVLCMQRLSTHF